MAWFLRFMAMKKTSIVMITKNKINRHLLRATMGLALTTSIPGNIQATEPDTASSSSTSNAAESLYKWWDGTSPLGDMFGLKTPLEDAGFKFAFGAKEIYYGQVSGGLPNQPKSNWVNEVKIKLTYDFSKVFKIEGLTFDSDWRYRNDNGSEYYPYVAYAAGTSGASSMFNPSDAVSGMGVRIRTQQLEWKSDKSKTPTFTINLGWENPYDQFLQQPLSKLFENNAIASAKGIGGQAGAGMYVVNNASAVNAKGQPTSSSARSYATTSVPWSSSYATWGGTIKVRPTSQAYIQSGLYLAYSGASGIGASQLTATSVYPHTSVPKSYLGKFRNSGMVVPEVGTDGKPTGKYQNLGWVPERKNNHGFNFAGASKFNPNKTKIGVTPKGYSSSNATYAKANYQPYDLGSGGSYQQNGLYTVTEIGWEPKLTDNKLDGKYALGGYIWGQENTSFQPVNFSQAKGTYTSTYNGKKPTPSVVNQVVWGLYLQADQMLYREPSTSHSNSSESTVSYQGAVKKPSKQGLYMFNMATFTPPQNNALPFYFQTGLVYQGLIPMRNEDQCGIALGCGFYSSYYNDFIESQNKALYNQYGSRYNGTVPDGPIDAKAPNATTGKLGSSKAYFAYAPNFTSTQVLEGFYQVQLNKWATFKPYVQYIRNPAGNNTVPDDWILGASVVMKF